MADRLERLLNLTATLLDTRRPLTLDEVAARVAPPYPADRASRHRQFERDKETLRELGIEISVENIDPLGGAANLGYRIRPERYYLPELELSDEEREALHVAVTAVRLEGDDAREALIKLGGLTGESAPAVADLPASPVLGELFDATAQRAPVAFGYRGEDRELEPYGVVLRLGHWYVVGHDLERDAPRAFRVDRIDGAVSTGAAASFSVPDGFDPEQYLRDDPLLFGDDRAVRALVLVDPERAAWVVEQLGDAAVEERRDDGAVVVGLDVVNRDAFRSWLFGLLDYATVIGPPTVRDDVVTWLRSIAGRTELEPRP
ncbi:MAG: WYL domain-containing protein [Actinobacteria bacterium]|nr:WYL domain-containing protein [Actinomycetota bacterium]